MRRGFLHPAAAAAAATTTTGRSYLDEGHII
jgi:hypothetical protein